MNPLRKLQEQGQAVWLDYIRRHLIISGELKRMVEEDGLTGITVNPTVLGKVVTGSDDYDDKLINILKKSPHIDTQQLYEKLIVQDIQMAADILRPVYEATNGADGYVSLDLPPSLAYYTDETVAEARRFWKLIDRPNLMLKIPATADGISAIERLIAEGINVNITLIFSLNHYEAATSAYIRGVEKCAEPCRVASVASFSVSRVDRVVNANLERIGTPEALALRGKIAIANSKMTYKRFKTLFSGERWEKLAKRGVKPQRLLWANTDARSLNYSDVLYVEELIGQRTISLMSPATMNAFKDHGKVKSTLEEGMSDAEAQLKELAEVGVDLVSLTDRLQVDEVKSFNDSYNGLLNAFEEKSRAVICGRMKRQNLNLGKYTGQVDKRLNSWEENNFAKRFWAKDPTIWFSKPVPEITDRLGWLFLPQISYEQLDSILTFADDVKAEGIRHIVLLGIGGSSLASEVYRNIFGSAPGCPELMIIDSVHPGAIRAIEHRINMEHTLFILASKSGTTLEPLALFKYFWEKTKQIAPNPGRHFIAITDPGTPLEKLAQEKRFRRIFLAMPDLCGRYSALSMFGLVPAALIGIDVQRLLDRAWVAAESCAFCVSERRAPPFGLGAALGELAERGRDKVTFIATSSIGDFPYWLEQLVAESTGKDGKGILPVVNEPFEAVERYGDDRFFIFFSLEGDDDRGLERMMEALESAGHPTARLRLTEKADIGMEIFRWEVAVASAGAVIGVHPFNQPDVEISKEFTRRVMGKDRKIIGEAVETVSVDDRELVNAVKRWLSQASEGGYIAIHAYLEPAEEATELLQKIRLELLNRFNLSTTLGYGPRFLHSTGQLHKGGPNTGLFLQLIEEPKEDLQIPSADYTFSDILHAQSIGDYLALKKRGRKVLRVNLKKDTIGGLSLIEKVIRNSRSK